MYKEKLKKISKYIYELPKSEGMLVPGRIFISETLLKQLEEGSIKQVRNVAILPGIEKYSIGLSDIHLGYGFPIGGVAAFNMEEGIISPGGVGYDINCSVRLLRTNLTKKDLQGKEKQISKSLFNAIPSGIGKGGKVKINKDELKEILKKGAKWAVDQGLGKKEDYEYCEENGCMQEADVNFVSDKALSRGVNQLGSIGSGNHFIEVQSVDKIFDDKTAKVYGLKKDQVVIMIHCGSRGLGHQVASDYIKAMEEEYGIENLEDRQLINAPINSKLGKEYYKAMCAAANFAFCNKQVITHYIRETMKRFFPNFKAEVVYDVCHNIAKFEKHKIDGKKKMLCVHRKGATRSYGPGNLELPKKYQKIGQPILIPGSMGTSSYVLKGTNESEELTFSSTAHGAGRLMSRHQALKTLNRKDIEKNLADKNIALTSGSNKGVVEEAPSVYKDVDEVVRVSDELDIGNIVAKLIPAIVMKG